MTEAEIAEARQLVARLNVLLNPVVSSVRPEAPPSPVAQPVAVLSVSDYEAAAAALGCDVATVKAVCDVESNGKAFHLGRPVILFEPHVFSRLTNHRFDNPHGGVSYPKQGTKPYPPTQNERWAHLDYAAKLDADAALQSASYGLFQIMGFNYKACGFRDVQEFVAAMRRGVREHLVAFVAFVKSNNLDGALRARDWATFARGYNGPGYAANAYDTKLAHAYAKHKG